MKFFSQCPNQILTITPNQIIVNQGVVQTVSGKRIEFQNGEYETTDKKEIDFIKKHNLFGFKITSAEEDETKQEGK